MELSALNEESKLELERLRARIAELEQQEATLQATLHTTQTQLAGLLANSNQSVMLLDRDYRVVACNEIAVAATQLVYAQPLKIGDSILRFVAPTDLADFQRNFQKTLAGETTFIERNFPDTKGNTRWWEFYFAPIFSATGEISLISFIVRDITRYKQAQDENVNLNRDLERRVDELQTLLDVIPIGIIIAEDPQSEKMRVNAPFARMMGIPADANVSKYAPEQEEYPYRVLRNGQELPPEELPMQTVMRTKKELVEAEYDIERGDGQIVNYFGYAAPLFDEAGNVRGGVGAFLDITERKRLERMQNFLVEASEFLNLSLDVEQTIYRLLSLIVPFLADACTLFMRNEDGTFSSWVYHCLADKEELLRELRQKFPLDHSFDESSEVGKAFKEGKTLYVPEINPEFLAQNISDPAHLAMVQNLGLKSAVCVPLVTHGDYFGLLVYEITEGNRHYQTQDVTVAEDLTRRAALALTNSRLYRQAQAAIKTRDEFLSVAAHELRTPITSLRGYAQLLMRQLNRGQQFDETRLRNSLEIFERQTTKISRLTDQLLDISRLENGRLPLDKQPTNLCHLVKEVVASEQTQTEQHIISFCVMLADEIVAEVDALRIEQVLTNLLNNAIKYSPNGGTIEVVLSQPSGPEIRLTITDSGIGIPEEHRANIFNRFYQAHSPGHLGGMGLGLYICRQIIERHGGQIWAEFPPAGGTRFVISLPV